VKKPAPAGGLPGRPTIAGNSAGTTPRSIPMTHHNDNSDRRRRRQRKRAQRKAAKDERRRRHAQDRLARQRPAQPAASRPLPAGWPPETIKMSPDDEARARRVAAHHECLLCAATLTDGGRRFYTAGSAWSPLPIARDHEYTAHLCRTCDALPQAEKKLRLALLVGYRWLGARMPRAERAANVYELTDEEPARIYPFLGLPVCTCGRSHDQHGQHDQDDRGDQGRPAS
jgi:hypothetical protein